MADKSGQSRQSGEGTVKVVCAFGCGSLIVGLEDYSGNGGGVVRRHTYARARPRAPTHKVENTAWMACSSTRRDHHHAAWQTRPDFGPGHLSPLE